MIRVVYHRNPFDPTDRQEWTAPWGEDATAADLAPIGADLDDLDCLRNGQFVSKEDWTRRLHDGDLLVYAYKIQGVEATAFSFLGQTVFTASGALAVGATIGSYLVNAFLLGAAVRALTGPDEKPANPGEADSRYYSFGGITANSDYSGAAIPVVYGDMRVAGLVVNRFVRAVSAPTESFLYTLLVLAGHQVQRIGDKEADGGPFTSEAGNLPAGLQIDNQPAENLAGVECYVRMGTAEQDPIPGFELAKQQVAVGNTLLESADVANVEADPGVYGGSDPEITKWDTEVSYTMGADADEATAVINFPQGLFDISSTGSVRNRTVRLQARYVEVDGSGTPISNYVVLPPFADVTSNLRTAFDVEFPVQFIDPADYSPPSGGEVMIATAAGAYGLGPATSTNFLAQGPTNTQMTVFAWVRLSYTLDSTGQRLEPAGGTVHPIYGQYDTANVLGWKFAVTEAGDTSIIVEGEVVTTPQLNLRITGGDGTTAHSWAQGGTGLAQRFAPASLPTAGGGSVAGSWVFCGVSYRANVASDGSGELILWAGDAQAGSTIKPTSSQRPLWDTTQQIRVGSEQGTATTVEGFIDECVVYQRAFSATEFLSRGTSPASASEQGIVAGWHFDVGFTDFVGSNDLTATGGATISSSGGGPVSGGSTGTLKPSKYRLDIQRINAEATGQFAQDEAVWSSVVLTEYEPFSYPGCAMIAVKVKATDQLSGSAPLITVPVKGKLCNVWDGVDPVNPTVVREWSNNPAWILADIATDTELTGTPTYQLAKLDWTEIEGFADYCDALVIAGTGSLDLVQSQVAGTATTTFPNGYIEFEVSATGYPLSWPDVAFLQDPNDVGDDLNGLGWIEVYDTGEDGSAPSWLTAHEGDVFPIGQVRYISSGRYEIRAALPVTEPSTSPYSPPSGTIQVRLRERRMRFDGVFDRDDFALKDTLLRVAQSARGVPLFQGDRLSVFWDAPRTAAHQVTMGNIGQGSWRMSATGADARFNHEIIQFLDRDSNYEADQDQDYGSDIINPAIADAVRTRRTSLEGVVRRSQVRRQIRYDLNVYELLRRYVEFAVGPDSIGYQIGDVVEVSHDVPQWGLSGRLIQDSPDAQTLYLDRTVVVEAATDYEVTIRDNATGAIETVAVTGMGTGTYLAGETITLDSALSFTPKKDALYAWGESGLSTRSYQVVDVSFDLQAKSRRVRCLEYDANVYDDDFGQLEDGESLNGPEEGSDSLGGGIESLVLTPDTPIGADGRVSASLRVSWTYNALGRESTDSVLVWLADSDGSGLELVGQVAYPASSYTLPSDRLDLGTEYQVRLQEVTRAGQRRSLASAQRGNAAVGGFGPVLAAPTGLSASVAGELLYVRWDPDSVSRARTVEIRMGGWILGTPVGHAPASQGYLVVEQWASGPVNDVGKSAPDLVARAIDSLGRPGAAARLTFDADVVDTETMVAFESNREDSGTAWAGTKTALTVTPVPVGDPPLERTATLGWTGSGTSASYSFSADTLPEPEEVYAQVFVEAAQIHPRTWGDMTAWGSEEMQRWTWEGPLYVLPDETPNASLSVSLAHNVSGTVTSSERTFVPGKVTLRASDVAIHMTRPNDGYNALIERMAVRYTRVHPPAEDHLSIGVFR